MPELSYKDLDIQQGDVAALEWLRLIQMTVGEETSFQMSIKYSIISNFYVL